MLAWTSNTSESTASKGCCHFVVAVAASTSSGLTRTRLSPPERFSQRTVAVSRYCTPSSLAICGVVFVVFLYWFELVRAITCSPGSAASLPRTSSVIPSAKYSSSGAPRFSKGRTARSLAPPAADAGA